MTESGESLSNSKKYCSVLEKISKINDVKQNEKHPFRYGSFVYCIEKVVEKIMAMGETRVLIRPSCLETALWPVCFPDS